MSCGSLEAMSTSEESWNPHENPPPYTTCIAPTEDCGHWSSKSRELLVEKCFGTITLTARSLLAGGPTGGTGAHTYL